MLLWVWFPACPLSEGINFYTATCPLGARFLSVVRRSKVVRISEVENVLFLWQRQSGHVACPLYGGCPYLGVSVMGGSTVVLLLETFRCCFRGLQVTAVDLKVSNFSSMFHSLFTSCSFCTFYVWTKHNIIFDQP